MTANRPRLPEFYPIAGKSRPHSGYSMYPPTDTDGQPQAQLGVGHLLMNIIALVGVAVLVIGPVVVFMVLLTVWRFGLWWR